MAIVLRQDVWKVCWHLFVVFGCSPRKKHEHLCLSTLSSSGLVVYSLTDTCLKGLGLACAWNNDEARTLKEATKRSLQQDMRVSQI